MHVIILLKIRGTDNFSKKGSYLTSSAIDYVAFKKSAML